MMKVPEAARLLLLLLLLATTERALAPPCECNRELGLVRVVFRSVCI
jgi:hypothetical protein